MFFSGWEELGTVEKPAIWGRWSQQGPEVRIRSLFLSVCLKLLFAVELRLQHTWCLKEVQTTKNSPTVEGGFFGRYWWVQSSPKISKVGHWGILNKWHFCVFLLIWCKELLSELTKQYHHDPGRVQTTLKHYPGVWYIIISNVGPLWGLIGPYGGPQRALLA